MVRCKFKCDHVMLYESGAAIKLTPVTTGSEENKEFYHYTPGGMMALETINLEAAKQFVPGKEYLIFIDEATHE
jgi:hypothetical protein